MLTDVLQQKKSIVVSRWLDLILESYPPNSAQFFRQERNQFANPVGYNLARDMESLFDIIICRENENLLAVSLDNIIRIRAVQDFDPSQAVRFIYLLKTAIREVSDSDNQHSSNDAEWRELELRIDESALAAFDIYCKCRDKINAIRINEIKARAIRFSEKSDSYPGIARQGRDARSDND